MATLTEDQLAILVLTSLKDMLVFSQRSNTSCLSLIELNSLENFHSKDLKMALAILLFSLLEKKSMKAGTIMTIKMLL